ncbi:unnamed protein product [Sordaria macrospora k-hell]|uniref:WGS project CABT00000000 data, contig 2.78 n=1 Tax=Sordaria macrospora (strain ATCC MYA-333 / DSM 997 / K(L3346) / K-hell) TaxID=771870 RepID=F7WBK3_SORMK|nr:uncharacterized protein SMAC_09213 [Sordaria macrospora k-hell]CCC14432.1 unnamed protein product [Sordaria macrospora k-hell]
MAAFPFLSASLVLFQLALCSAQHLNLTGPFHLTNHKSNQNLTAHNTSQPLNLTTHTSGDGCVHLPIIHSTNIDHFARRGIQLALNNRSDVAYYAQLEIGTPPQTVYTQLDTGSFELWVNPDCTTVSASDSIFCQRIGHYNASSSSTAVSLGTNKTLHYGIGSANISYVTDVVSLAGTSSASSLKKVQFGVATSSKDAFSGILGIGYGQGLATKYPNFVDQLYAQNVTKVKAYTLALGSKSAKEGTIVFGGVDTSKFSGPLAKVPIISAAASPDGVPRFWVQMGGINLTPPSGEPTAKYEGSQIPAFLDSGSTMTILPPKLAGKIAKDFGSPAADANGFYQVGSVFDLQTHSIWLTQASSCGSTPAALRNVTDLSRVVGKCAVQPGQQAAVVDVVSETSIPRPSTSTAAPESGSGGTGTITTGFVSTTLAIPTGTASASLTAAGSTDGGVSGIAATAVAGGASGMRSSAGSRVLGVAVAVGVAVLTNWG